MKRFASVGIVAFCMVGSTLANGWLDYVGTGNGNNAKMNGTYNSLPYGGSGTSVFSGQINVKYSNNQTGGPWSSTISTFCISPDRALLGTPAQDPWDILTPVQYNAGVGDNSVLGRVARLVGYGARVSVNNTSQDMFYLNGSGGADDQRASIFQAVLWALVSTGNDLNIDIAGSNGISGSLLSHAGWLAGSGTHFDIYQEYWDAALDLSKTGSMYLYYPNPNGIGSNNQQILVGEAFGGGAGFTPVPEPFTMALGLAAVGAFVRRRIRADKVLA
ncbi:MAG: PEP-CTERM sorting domain-containing protein [Chlorobia bacterium]|nr:PEP-CTERM sorting domain-containing protein [Fimbriimonadaceae bacterium]